MKNALVETFGLSGKILSDDLALECAELTTGYPYMIQLIGYYVWQSAERSRRNDVLEEDVERGFQDALLAFGDAVRAPAFDALAPAARKFILAMAQDAPNPSRVAEIAERLGKSRSWANKYREVLISQRVVRPADYGYVEFAIPHMASYLVGRVR